MEMSEEDSAQWFREVFDDFYCGVPDLNLIKRHELAHQPVNAKSAWVGEQLLRHPGIDEEDTVARMMHDMRVDLNRFVVILQLSLLCFRRVQIQQTAEWDGPVGADDSVDFDRPRGVHVRLHCRKA